MTASEEKPAPSASPGPRPRSRLRKWTFRILIFVAGVVLLVGGVIQAALWTGLPKSIIVSQVEKGLGLRMDVTSVSSGWFGQTTLHGVKLALPLSEEPFADVPDMNVRHTSLLAMIFGRPLLIKEVDLDKPVMQVWQNASGRWNFAEVADLLSRVGDNKSGQETSSSDVPALPRININQMKAVIRDNRNHQLTLDPVNLSSGPETPVSYAFDLEVPSGQPDVPPHLSLKGRVAPGGPWAHTVRLWVHDIDPWIAAWKPGFNVPVTFDGNWSGEIAQTGVKGYLQVTDAAWADYHANGAINAARLDGAIRLSPSDLKVRTGIPTIPQLTLAKGEVTYDGTIARMTRLQVAMLDGPAELNGWFQPSINQGAVEAYWQDLKTGAIQQSGKLNVTYKNPLASDLTLDLLASSSGTAPDGPFEALFKLNATGRSFRDLSWHLDAPQLAWHRPVPILLDGLIAAGSYHQDAQHQIIRLSSVALSTDNRLSGTGSWDLATKEGELHLSGQDWPVHVIEGTKLAFALDATGKGVPSRTDPKKTEPFIELTQFILHSGDTALTLKGTFDGREPKPVSAEVVFENEAGDMTRKAEPEILQGFVRGSAKLKGTLLPLEIDLDGKLASRNAMVLNHVVGDMNTGVKGGINFERAFIRADAIPFLNGIWTMGGTYVAHRDGKPVYATEIDLAVDRLPLPNVSRFLDIPIVEGTFDGRWYLYFPGLKPKASRLILTGGGSIDHLAAADFVADKVTYKTTINQGQIKIDPIEITRGSYGRAVVSASTSMDHFREILVGVDLSQFPIDMGALQVQTTGGSKQIVIDLPNAKADDPLVRQLRIEGDVVTRTALALNQQPIGEIRSTTKFRGRVAEIADTEGDLLGGKFTGSASTDFDDLNHSRMDLGWNNLQSDRFVRLFPQLKGLGGTLSGNLRLAPAVIPRPLQPLSLDVYVHVANGRWRTVHIGDGQIHAFVNPETFQVIASESQLTSIQLAGGSVNCWFSGSRHIDTAPTPEGVEKQTGVTISNLINVTLNNLQVDQFVQAFDPKHLRGLGKLSGELYTLSAPKTRNLAVLADPTTQPTAATSPTTKPTQPNAETVAEKTALPHILATMMVDGELRIDQSNLAEFGPIKALYNLMHLGQDIRTPTGRGKLALHMEQGQLHISNLYFFNRGLEVRGVATIDRIWDLPDNPVTGSAVGTLRPLKSIKVPVLAETEAILSQIQGGLTGIEFAGPVKDPAKSTKQISLSEFGGELRGLLLGAIGSNR